MNFLLLFVLSIHASSLSLTHGLSSSPRVEYDRPMPTGPIHTLILTRHGDSYWNGKYPGCHETFTGWTDVGLSPIGEREAIRTGRILAEYTGRVDAMFTSTLTRAKMTAHHCWWAYNDRLEEEYRNQKHYQYYNQPNDGMGRDNERAYRMSFEAPSRFVIDHRLNERHYGSLQGLIKAEVESGIHGHSPEDVRQWRRSWHTVPPPLSDDDPRRVEELRLFANICGECNVPKGESLAMVAKNRIRPFLAEKLTPMLDGAYESKLPSSSTDDVTGEVSLEGGTALIVAHANSLRALIGVVCNVEREPLGLALEKLESMKIPTASPLVIRYRRTTENDCYYPVDDALGKERRNELPVYPLSSLPLLRKRTHQIGSTPAMEAGQNHAAGVKRISLVN
jgi:2,3-bisphosphoglycerate-dependent phosphoglycerate mutase